MTINERLITAVTSVVPICVPDYYPGEASEYTEFEIDAEPDWYWDDLPHATMYDITLRLFLPVEENATVIKNGLRDALSAAEFSLQYVEDIGDNLTQGYEYTLRYWEPVEETNDGIPAESKS